VSEFVLGAAIGLGGLVLAAAVVVYLCGRPKDDRKGR
jgi:hypothetical protein